MLYLVKGVGPSFLHRNWLAHLRLEWPQTTKVLAVTQQKTTQQKTTFSSVEKLSKKYYTVFQENFVPIFGGANG